MRALGLISLLALVPSLAACGGPDTSPTSNATRAGRHGLLKGSPSASAAAVQVLIQLEKEPTEETSFACSGVVVSPHVVLTAAHCVSPQIVTQGQSFFIFKGDDSNDEGQLAKKSNFGYAKEVRFDPAWKATSFDGGHDIGAVIVLDPLDIEPARLHRKALDASVVGESARLIGYGMRKAGSLISSGHRDETTLPIAGVDERELWFAPPRGSGVCEGDSGGPSLMTVAGVEVVVGIHSHLEHVTSCTGKMFDTRVDLYVDTFIDPIIREVDPGFLEAQAPKDADTQAETAEDTPKAGTTPAVAPQAAPRADEGCSVTDPSKSATPWCGIVLALAVATARRRGRRRADR